LYFNDTQESHLGLASAGYDGSNAHRAVGRFRTIAADEHFHAAYFILAGAR